MQKIVEKNLRIREPVVVLPLREWQNITGGLEDMEEAARFNEAFQESRGQKMLSLKLLSKKYNLK